MKTVPLALDDWKKRLQEQQRQTVQGILNFGKAIYEFNKWCKKKQGGSTFTESVQSWLGISQPSASKWRRIGEQYDKLIRNANRLPASWDTIYLIAELPEDVIAEEVDPEVTRQDAEVIRYARGVGCRAVRKTVNALVHERSMRGGDLPRTARELGIDPDDYPTTGSLQAAVWNARALKRAVNLPPLDVPDGSAVADRAELTALKPHLRMPLRDRVEWCTQHGYNANVVLGLPFGVATDTIVAVYQSAVRELSRRSPLNYHEAKEWLQRAVNDLLGIK